MKNFPFNSYHRICIRVPQRGSLAAFSVCVSRIGKKFKNLFIPYIIDSESMSHLPEKAFRNIEMKKKKIYCKKKCNNN